MSGGGDASPMNDLDEAEHEVETETEDAEDALDDLSP